MVSISNAYVCIDSFAYITNQTETEKAQYAVTLCTTFIIKLLEGLCLHQHRTQSLDIQTDLTTFS